MLGCGGILMETMECDRLDIEDSALGSVLNGRTCIQDFRVLQFSRSQTTRTRRISVSGPEMCSAPLQHTNLRPEVTC